MARIRTIKPEFPQSESVGRLSRDARLLFIQLWTIVDDAGRARAASRMLASLLYPYDDDAQKKMEGWLLELEGGQMIRRYEVDGSKYLEICKWLEHQKIDRPSESRLPPYREPSLNPRESSRGLDADLVPSTMDLVPRTAAAAPLPKPSRAKPKVSVPDGYSFPQAVRDYATSKWGFTGSEIDRELVKFIRHAKTNDRRCADWNSAAENWFDKAAEFAGKQDLVTATDQKLADDGYIEVLDDEALQAWDRFRMAKEGKTFPRNKRGGWRFPSKYPPGYEPPTQTVNAPPIAMQAMS